MTWLAPAALVGWVFVSVALFTRLAPRRALLVCFIGGWLFLPITTFRLPGPLPDLNKLTVICAGALLGILFFDRAALLRFRPAWFDAPMAVWVLSPFMSSLANGLGVYDGLSAVLQKLLAWGIPYWLGRIYFFRVPALRELALAIFVGGLLYAPLCWFEIVVGPYIHLYFYGTLVGSLGDSLRFGGWRPPVLMEHGLMVALWMTTATVCGVILWFGDALTRWGRWRSAVLVIVLVITTIALKSVNAWLLLPFMVALLFVSVRMRRAWLVWGTAALVLIYLTLRASGLWNALEFKTLAAVVLPSKTESVAFRVVNEKQIGERARMQPVWGWGRWGRAYVGLEGGLPILIPDSVWIAAFGEQGTVGLVAVLGVLFLPPLLFSTSIPPAQWLSTGSAPVSACALVTFIFALDSMANAMLIPAFMLAAGGIVGWYVMTDRGAKSAAPSAVPE